MKINPHTYRIMLLHGYKMCDNIISCFKFYKMILWDGVTVFVIFTNHYNEIFVPVSSPILPQNPFTITICLAVFLISPGLPGRFHN